MLGTGKTWPSQALGFKTENVFEGLPFAKGSITGVLYTKRMSLGSFSWVQPLRHTEVTTAMAQDCGD